MCKQHLSASILLVLGLTSNLCLLRAQPAPQKTAAKELKESTTAPSPPPPREVHRFWDTSNLTLFAGVGGARALDFASSRHFRDRGVDEWLLTNGVVDNKPLFGGVEAATAGASIGISYLLHRSGHHKLERWFSVAHIMIGLGGSARNYTLRPHPQAISGQ
jgi:hypothetical protein